MSEREGSEGLRITVVEKLNGKLPINCVQNYLVCLAKRLTDDGRQTIEAIRLKREV